MLWCGVVIAFATEDVAGPDAGVGGGGIVRPWQGPRTVISSDETWPANASRSRHKKHKHQLPLFATLTALHSSSFPTANAKAKTNPHTHLNPPSQKTGTR